MMRWAVEPGVSSALHQTNADNVEMETKELYEMDNEHPIPDVDVVDINTAKVGGGSDLFIVVATALSGDRRSLERLLRKIERYLEFIRTDEFRAESGAPTIENTNIIVKIPSTSASAVFDLLERSRPWVTDNGATLVVETETGWGCSDL